ncbi:uncharacterized protein LOC126979342 [Leptidea sinapis]|uniref:uncharacterized protein LOC126979342 n=1 Tax=Leptidea sinapis TaxID=189913 RepID=UPI00212C4885|nr:uncharacterized protein LOC126979342 [Leptidea sinapis]
MLQVLFLLIIVDILNAVLYVDTGPTKRPQSEFETVLTDVKEKEKIINCEDFSQYSRNCTSDAALVYNSSRMIPPLPNKLYDWCKAIKHLTTCAMDWNIDCKGQTDSYFNEESIKGHIHVANNICDDDLFLLHYEGLTQCIESNEDRWEDCYKIFKMIVEQEKNTSLEWTHYDIHFNLCCARTSFRRCTLNIIFRSPSNCTHDQAVTLQKFSVIVSEGAVYQDCGKNIMYEQCPGGDPRPSKHMLKRLTSENDARSKANADLSMFFVFVSALIFFVHCLLFLNQNILK